MTKSDDRTAIDRRRFLGMTGIATTAAAAAATPLLATEAEAYDPGEDETRSKYQPDSPDVQAFYRTNAYETLKK
jgi:hypothetical protein